MNWVLDPHSSTSIPENAVSKLRRFRSDDESIESSSGIVYRKLAALGSGSYGSVVSCLRSTDKKKVAVKILTDSPIEDTLKETIIQAMIYQVSKDLKHPEIGLNGPYCPAVFEVGYDETTNQCFIVNEIMEGTTFKLLTASDGFNDVLESIVPTILIQISTMMIDLYKILQFNHRDFKSDNCMYVRNEDGEIQARLIDFGFSCVNYGNIQISGGGGTFTYCSLKSRDMTQYIYELYKFHPYLPDDIREVLQAILVFKTPESICYMYKKCNEMVNWRDTYTFLNTPLANPNGTPDAVLKIFKAYAAKKNWRKMLAYSPIELPSEKPAVPIVCPANKVYNPATQRCVKADGAIGKKLLLAARESKNRNVSAAAVGIKACPTRKPDYNPKTKRCVLPCGQGKRRNATFKCVRA